MYLGITFAWEGLRQETLKALLSPAAMIGGVVKEAMNFVRHGFM